MTAEGGKRVTTLIYVVKGECQSLLGLKDGKDLGIVRICPQGLPMRRELPSSVQGRKRNCQVQDRSKEEKTKRILKKNVKEIVNKYDQLFTGIGRAKITGSH